MSTHVDPSVLQNLAASRTHHSAHANRDALATGLVVAIVAGLLIAVLGPLLSRGSGDRAARRSERIDDGLARPGVGIALSIGIVVLAFAGLVALA